MVHQYHHLISSKTFFMILNKPFLLTILLASSLLSVKAQRTFNSVLTGKKISDTPLNEYIKEDVMGDQFILMIAYGCTHCRQAVQKAIRLKNNNSIDDFIILGSEAEETSAKADFMTTIGPDEQARMIDYDWTTFPKKFIIPEPGFPNPPVVFYIHDNIIISIMTEVPDSGNYRKLKGK